MKVKRPSDWDPQSAPTFWINHASRLLMRDFEKELRPFDFGMAYLPVAGALETNGPMLQRDLAEAARVEQPTMAALLTRMDRDGLITRKPHPTDGRSMQISLSAKARSRLPGAREALTRVADKATAGLSAKEAAVLIELLRRVISNLEDGRDESE